MVRPILVNIVDPRQRQTTPGGRSDQQGGFDEKQPIGRTVLSQRLYPVSRPEQNFPQRNDKGGEGDGNAFNMGQGNRCCRTPRGLRGTATHRQTVFRLTAGVTKRQEGTGEQESLEKEQQEQQYKPFAHDEDKDSSSKEGCKWEKNLLDTLEWLSPTQPLL